MPERLPIVILGAGGHGRVIADACLAAEAPVAGFLDAARAGALVGGLPVLGGDERLDDDGFVGAHQFAIGIADQAIRWRLGATIRARGGRLATVIHPATVIAPGVPIGAGSVLLAGAIVNTGAVLGELVIINTAASVDHDCILADGVHVGPGARLSGGVRCGARVLFGAGAIVKLGVTVGDDAIVGVGAVVVRDVASADTVVGNPARVMTPAP